MLLLLLILPLVLGDPYVPGTPGAPWTEYELITGEVFSKKAISAPKSRQSFSVGSVLGTPPLESSGLVSMTVSSTRMALGAVMDVSTGMEWG